MNQQFIWADGGLSQCAPRDTVVAYWGALGAAADGLCIGVQLTKDNVAICSSTDLVEASSGETARISKLLAADVRKLDAGAAFRSTVLDADNKETDQLGKDTPWEQHSPFDSLYYPTLEEVLRLFGRRTRLLLRPGDDSGSASEELMCTILALLDRFALSSKTMIAGDREALKRMGDRADGCLISDQSQSAAEAADSASEAGATAVIVSADRAIGARSTAVRLIVTPTSGHRAPTRDEYKRLAASADVAGYVAPAVMELNTLMHPRGLVMSDSFKGERFNEDLWVIGRSRPNDDTEIFCDDGMHIQIKGEEYSGAAALTAFSIYGSFDAQLDYEVRNPKQGTTFELAAIHVDAGYRKENLTFDVHGVPPYASSERDEDDGFRIGWNNGPALTEFVLRDPSKPFSGEPQSSNLYNNYSRDVGYAKRFSPNGKLRLTRNGDVFNAYYQDKFNPTWVLSGSVPVPALANAVFLRLGAKHWPKRGKPAPDNKFRFTDFELRQW